MKRFPEVISKIIEFLKIKRFLAAGNQFSPRMISDEKVFLG